jgi:predicted RNA-binding Zn ribbon-like protein
MGPAELVRDFVNTYSAYSDTEELASPAELTVWLREHDLAGPHDRAGEDDLALAVGLREGLRAAFQTGHGRPDTAEPSETAATLDSALAELPLRLAMGADGPVLRPAGDGLRGALAAIVAAVVGTQADGMWRRLKVCEESTCRWAFIDFSKNRSRTWCSMKICGNRTKTRAYRARQARVSRTRHS